MLLRSRESYLFLRQYIFSVWQLLRIYLDPERMYVVSVDLRQLLFHLSVRPATCPRATLSLVRRRLRTRGWLQCGRACVRSTRSLVMQQEPCPQRRRCRPRPSSATSQVCGRTCRRSRASVRCSRSRRRSAGCRSTRSRTRTCSSYTIVASATSARSTASCASSTPASWTRPLRRC